MRFDDIDGGREFDWGRTSDEYAQFRPGYPKTFYDLLSSLGIGRAGQRILDLGTGTGVLARAFAARGATVTGVDIAENQIDAARALAADQNLDVEFLLGPVEALDYPAGTFDVVSSAQSWLYFDVDVMIPKVLEWLAPDGCLVLTNLLWLPRKDAVARAAEALVHQFNPHWDADDYEGTMPPMFRWAKADFHVRTFHQYEEALPFTHASWRGRMRACRGVGASLSPEEVDAFDQAHARMLVDMVPDPFTVLHQLSVHAFVPKDGRSSARFVDRQAPTKV